MAVFAKYPCDELKRGGSAPARGSSPTFALVAAILGSSMSMIDGTAVNVALPVLQRDLHAGVADVQWVVEGYSLFLSALILIGGSLGDLYGRKRVFGLGIVLFALASLGCAAAPNLAVLVAARCLQGIGGALSVPGSLALISAAYDGEARGRAIGTWSGFSAIMAAIGPLLGGWLVQAASWRWVFIINLPIAAAVVVLLARVDESRDGAAPRHIDVPGAAFATAGLGALVFGLIRLQGKPDEFGALAVGLGLVALVAFVRWERMAPEPMMRLDLFASRRFAVANAYTFVLYAALGGSLFFVPFDLIDVQRAPPSLAGAALLPMIVIMFVFSRFSGGLVGRIGPRIPLALGAIVAGAGFATFALAGVDRNFWPVVLLAATVLGIGGAGFVAPLTTTVMTSVGDEHAGIASGINNALSRAAGLVAIAVLGLVLQVVSAHARAGGADARHAFAAGFDVVMVISGALAVLAGIGAWLALPPERSA